MFIRFPIPFLDASSETARDADDDWVLGPRDFFDSLRIPAEERRQRGRECCGREGDIHEAG